MPNKFATLAALSEAVTEAREKARREARNNCGRGFYQSRGAEWVVVDAGGDKVNESAAWQWDGTKRGADADLARLIEKFPNAARVDLEGGWDYAATMADMRDGGHAPLVSEWALTVWTAA